MRDGVKKVYDKREPGIKINQGIAYLGFSALLHRRTSGAAETPELSRNDI
jgi:hypothetical protein